MVLTGVWSLVILANLLIYYSYVPRKFYEDSPELKKAIDQIHEGVFSPENPDLFHDLTDHLLNHDR